MVDEISERIKYINDIYDSKPQCYLVAILLSTHFNGTIYYDSYHCITKIGDKYYDKSGEVSPDSTTNIEYLPLSEYGLEHDLGLMDALIQKHKNTSYEKYKISNPHKRKHNS